MAFPWIRHWIRILFLIFVIKGTNGQLWCFQCSWESGAVEAGTLVHCKDDGIKLEPNRINPAEQPHCTGQIVPNFSNETNYKVVKEACYKKPCAASQGGGVCAQWAFILKGKIVNTTLFCGVSQEIGCFDQPVEGGYTKRVCLCNDKNWCNTAAHTHSNKISVLLLGLLSTAVLHLINY